MEYVISYDLVGLFILFILFFLTRMINTAPTKANKFFQQFIVCSFAAAFLDVFTIWTNHYTSTPLMLFVNNLLAVIHILAVNTIPLIYYMFVLSITHEQRKIGTGHIIFCGIFYGYDFLTILTSPFTKLIMYYTENGEYTHGPAFVGTYIIIILFLIAGTVELSRNIRRIKVKKFLIVLSYTIIDVGAALYQLFHPNVLLLGLYSSISLIVISFSLKNPMEFMDINLGLYNRAAFKEYLYNSKHKRVLAVIKIKNADAIKYMYGLDNGFYIIRQLIENLTKECKQKNGFHIFTNTIGFICKDLEEAEYKLQLLNSHRTNPVYINTSPDSKEVNPVCVEFDSYIMDNYKLLENGVDEASKKNPLDQIIDIIHYIVETKKDLSKPYLIKSEIIENYKEQQRIQHIVDEAIKNERFEVFLQPIFDLKLKRFTGAESLIRLRDYDGKMISPGLFIPEAERNGKILALGDISIKKTCEFIRDGNLKSLGIEKVNINLSMVQCMQDNIVSHIIEILESYKIPKEMFRFEITETITTTNPLKLKKVMTDLTAYGIEFALDDYGTGYSNTSRLLDFPFSEIKFDKSFVDSTIEDKKNALPLKHLMNMVSDSNMIVLVEGIETKEMSDLIESYGGNLIQGYYYSKPLPLDEFVKFLNSSN